MIIEWYRELFLFLWKYLGFFGGIVGISVIVSLACFPIYNVIGRIVGMENALQSVLNPAVAKIRETISDAAERQSAIERLYARFGYHPIMGVRKVLPLFVSIPFLMFTYYMLAGTTELAGVKWLCFSDLSKPDGLLFGFNLLPFVMTGVNLLTVYATPCFNKKDEVQAWVIALFFLVLLYSANTALMIYWTLNQIFNFGRTLFENHFAGARLLASRFAAFVRALADLPHRTVSNSALAYGIVVSSAMTFYLFVFQYLIHATNENAIVFHFSRWTFNLCFFVAVVCTVKLFMRERIAPRLLLLVVLVTSGLSVAPILITLCSLPFTDVVLNRVELSAFTFTRCFAVNFLLWGFVLLFGLRHGIIESCKKGVCACWSEFEWLLIPLALGIHYSYSSENLDVTLLSVCRLSLYLLLPPLLLSFSYIVFFHRWINPPVLVRLVFGMFIAIYLMPMVSTMSGFWLCYTSNIALRLALIAIVSILTVKLANHRCMRSFACVLLLASIVHAFLVPTAGKGSSAGESSAESSVSQCSALAQAKCVRTNSVYLLVYDSYAHDVVMEGFGFPNQINGFLKDKGFTRYDSFSVGAGTLPSMHALFTIGDIEPGSPRSMIVGNNVFCEFLKKDGYRTSYLLSGYSMPNRGERMPGDYYFPKPQDVVPSDGVLLPWILRGILTQAPNVFNDYSFEDWCAAKRTAIANAATSCSFIYAHCGSPGHATYNATYWRGDEIEIGGFKQRTQETDALIKKDVEQILAKDPNAIVVLASDHGGFLTTPWKCNGFDARYFLDHHGILLSVRWPKDYEPVLDLACFQNLLPEILIYLTGDQSLKSLSVENGKIGSRCAAQGVSSRGIIQSGADAGQSIFSAARERFRQRK